MTDGLRSAGADDDAYAALRRETPTERSDRNWVELLQEFRVVQTGVQLLTGFLLTLPFQARFAQLDRFQRTVYLVTLLLAVVSLTFFVAPVGYHRALFQRRSKARLVASAARFARAGLATVSLVFTGGVLLVVDVVAGRAAGLAAGASIFLLIVVCWYLLPQRAVRAVRSERDGEERVR